MDYAEAKRTFKQDGFVMIDLRPLLGGDATVKSTAEACLSEINARISERCGLDDKDQVDPKKMIQLDVPGGWLMDRQAREQRWGKEKADRFSFRQGPRWNSGINLDGMGPCANIYEQEITEEALRPVFAELYASEDEDQVPEPHRLVRCPERLGLVTRIGQSAKHGAAGLHHDHCFIRPEERPKERDGRSQKQTWHPKGKWGRIQCVLALSGDCSRWMGIKGMHRPEIHDAYGEAIGWPHSSKNLPNRPLPLNKKAFAKVQERFPDIVQQSTLRMPPGHAIFWWSSIAHANVGLENSSNLPRLVMYCNYGRLADSEPSAIGDKPALTGNVLGIGQVAELDKKRKRSG